MSPRYVRRLRRQERKLQIDNQKVEKFQSLLEYLNLDLYGDDNSLLQLEFAREFHHRPEPPLSDALFICIALNTQATEIGIATFDTRDVFREREEKPESSLIITQHFRTTKYHLKKPFEFGEPTDVPVKEDFVGILEDLLRIPKVWKCTARVCSFDLPAARGRNIGSWLLWAITSGLLSRS